MPKNKSLVILLLILIIGLPALAYKQADLKNLLNKLSAPPTPYYFCPAEANFCKNGKDIAYQNQYLGFGGKLEATSAIYAAISGKVTIFKTILPTKPEEQINTIYIDSDRDGVRVVYFFNGQTFTGSQVQKGDLIGKVESDIKAFNTSLVIQTIKGDPAKSPTTHLTPKDFGF